MDGFNAVGFMLVLAGWMFSLCFHEFAHAWVAYRGGDVSVRDKGYLTFNPARYTNLVDSLVWPLVFFLLGGLALPGGAVYVNRAALRSRGWDAAVSLAGPAANLLLLLVLVVPFWLGLVDVQKPTIMWAAYGYLCVLQVMAALFNLLPIPPLDGFGVISAFWDPVTRARAYAMSSFTFMILLFLLWSDTGVSRAFWYAVLWVSHGVGVPLELASEGRAMMPRPF
jgi:Zn-dependent protease